MDRRLPLLGAVAGVLAAVLFAVCETVTWNGRPGEGSTGSQVIAYYGAHARAVLFGAALWIVAVSLVALAVVAGSRTLHRGGWFRVSSVPGLAALAGGAALAAWLALSAGGRMPGDALAIWRGEGSLYQLGADLVLLPMAVALLELRGLRLAAMTALILVTSALLLLGPGLVSFTAALLWFAALPLSASLPDVGGRARRFEPAG